MKEVSKLFLREELEEGWSEKGCRGTSFREHGLGVTHFATRFSQSERIHK